MSAGVVSGFRGDQARTGAADAQQATDPGGASALPAAMAHPLPRSLAMARSLFIDTFALALVLASMYACDVVALPSTMAPAQERSRPAAVSTVGAAAPRPGNGAAKTPATFSPRTPPKGTVRVEQGVLVDDDGPFWAIGATYMAAPWFYKFDRARLEANLAFLADHGIDYVRVLGEVGGRFWQGREIDPRWPDYEQVIAGLTDLAYDKYGLRVQWTVFGGVDFSTTPERRQAQVDRIVRMTATRPQKVMLVEIGNEAWKNGFLGERGRDELRVLAERAVKSLRSQGIRVPVAPSAPPSSACADVSALYRGLSVEVATVHFSRDVSGPEGAWAPVTQPARYGPCAGAPAVTINNEPIGTASSVVSETEPVRLVSAALVTLLSRMPLHVFHSRAGVRGDVEFASLPNVNATLAGLSALHRMVPKAIARAAPVAVNAPEALLELRSPVVPDVSAGPGVVGYYATRLDGEELAGAVGVRGPLSLRARRAVNVETYDLLTGDVVKRPAVAAGATVSLDGRGAWFIRARPAGE